MLLFLFMFVFSDLILLFWFCLVSVFFFPFCSSLELSAASSSERSWQDHWTSIEHDSDSATWHQHLWMWSLHDLSASVAPSQQVWTEVSKTHVLIILKCVKNIKQIWKTYKKHKKKYGRSEDKDVSSLTALEGTYSSNPTTIGIDQILQTSTYVWPLRSEHVLKK